MQPEPDFLTNLSFADCAAQVLQEARKTCFYPATDKNRWIYHAVARHPVRALRAIARCQLMTVGARVAIWRGKDETYIRALMERLRRFEQSRATLDAK